MEGHYRVDEHLAKHSRISLYRILIIIVVGLSAIGVSLFTLNKNSFPTHNTTEPNTCLSFLGGGCDNTYYSKNYRVTDFKPINNTAIVVGIISLVTYFATIALMTVGKQKLTGGGITLFISLGILLFALSLGGFYFYGIHQRGKSVFIGGLTQAEHTCIEDIGSKLGTTALVTEPLNCPNEPMNQFGTH